MPSVATKKFPALRGINLMRKIALEALFQVLDQYSLADLLPQQKKSPRCKLLDIR